MPPGHGAAHASPDMIEDQSGRLRFLRRATDRQRRSRLRRGVYLLPSLFTMGNMFCGYACIVYAMRNEFETAAPFIGFAFVLDILDGRVARMTGTKASSACSSIRLPTWSRSASRRRFWRFSGACSRSAGLDGRPVSCSWPAPRCGWRASISSARQRQALFRRDAEPGRGGDSGIDRVFLSRRPVRLSRRAAGAGDGAGARRADGQHDPVPRFKTIDSQTRRPYWVLIFIAAGIMLVATHPRFMLVAIWYGYLLSGFIGLAIARFRHRGRTLAGGADSAAAAPRDTADHRDSAAR